MGGHRQPQSAGRPHHPLQLPAHCRSKRWTVHRRGASAEPATPGILSTAQTGKHVMGGPEVPDRPGQKYLQDEYKRISKKIAEISIILKKKKEDRKKPNGELYQPSEILMMQAYKAIHGYITDALVTNFKDDANAEALLEQIL